MCVGDKGMTIMLRLIRLTVLLTFGCAALALSGPVPPATPPVTDSPILQLDTRLPVDRRSPLPEAVHTMWRYWETRQPEIFKFDSGEIFRADPLIPVAVVRDKGGQPIKGSDGKVTFELRKAREEDRGSPLPAAGWRESDYDDSSWARREDSMSEGWRGISLVCVRGKFAVQDPSKLQKLYLSVGFRGGIVAYLNGREVGRAFLPDGMVTPDTLAEMYPREAYVYPNTSGTLINERSGCGADYYNYVLTSKQAEIGFWGSQFLNKENLAAYQKRCRRLEIQIPASALRKGVNVLALEVHRAPANEIMWKALASTKDANILAANWQVHLRYLGKVANALWWNHASIEDIRLSVPAGTTGITPNVGRPQGFQVWNESIFQRILPVQYGDPNEQFRPIRMQSVRNGTCSAQIVAGSSGNIRGLRAVVSDLKGAAGVIPASAVQVGYMCWWNENQGWRNDALDPDPPAELRPLTKSIFNPSQSMGRVAGAVEAIWFTAQVPKTAKAGIYSGKVTIGAEGEKSVETTIELKVVGDWVCPDPDRFTTYMGIIESPDSVAALYHVPLWSEEHWQLLDKVFELLGQLGNRELYIPLITRTMLGNEQSMVRWIKQADGAYKPDFSIAERYMDLAVKHHWNVASTCLAVSDGGLGQAIWYSGKPRNPPSVSTLDPITKTVGEMAASAWGTPEARTFWKPAIEGMQDRLKKRGMGKSMMYGFVVQNQVLVETIGDIKSITPDVKWWEYTHWSPKRKGSKEVWQDVGRTAFAFGAPLAVFWSPDEEKQPHYAWRHLAKDVFFVAAPRGKAQINVGELGELSIFRLTCESTLLANNDGLIPELGPFCGIGEIGADFWPVPIGAGTVTTGSLGNKSAPAKAGEVKRLDGRYLGWGSLSLDNTMESILGSGRKAPTHSCRTQLLRESQQEAEARVFVQNAILDQKAKLGPELTERCRKICDDRTRVMNFCSVYFGENGEEYGRVFSPEQWDAQTELLYLAASDVAKALGGSFPSGTK